MCWSHGGFGQRHLARVHPHDGLHALCASNTQIRTLPFFYKLTHNVAFFSLSSHSLTATATTTTTHTLSVSYTSYKKKDLCCLQKKELQYGNAYIK